jgi:diguanylate cyclase (GGDEF)-like protein
MTPSKGDSGPISSGLETGWRGVLADRLRAGSAHLAAQAVAAFPDPADADAAALGASLARLLADTVRRGTCDPGGGDLAGLADVAARSGLTPAAIFAAVYRLMTSATELVGQDPTDEAASRADAVRRAAFDLLAAWTSRSLELPTAPALTDSLTTLHTRVVFDTVLGKECQRAERFEHWLSILLIQVTDLSAIHRTRGYGVGDQLLERMSILIRRYFRQHDWVARYGEDAVAVLLPETGPEDAQTLAGLMRTMIGERLAIDDEHQRPVSVSIAVASARPLNGYPVDPDRLLDELDTALERSSEGEPGRIESVEVHPVIDIEKPEMGSKESDSI